MSAVVTGNESSTEAWRTGILNRGSRTGIVVVVHAALLAALVLLPRIAQDPVYHHFADHRNWLEIPNALNVFSNLPFWVVGVLGLIFVARPKALASPHAFLDASERWPYALFFLGVALTCFGSAYYHLAPGNDRLVWDRLPMTIAFTSFFAAMIAERVSVRWGVLLLLPLLVAGAASVFYWDYTERLGAGDLRPYILIQFYPLVAVPLLLYFCPPRYTRSSDLVGGLAFYIAAKLLEVLDAQILSAGGFVSGHTLKHLAAALAPYWILRMLILREPSAQEQISACAGRS